MTDDELESAMLVPLAPAETFPDVEAATAALAIAEQHRDEAQAALAIAQTEEADLRERLNAVAERTEAIRRDLADGRLTEIEAGGLSYLAKIDHDELYAQLEQAELSAAECHATLQSADSACSAAASNLGLAKTKAEFDAMALQVKAIEDDLVRAVSALHAIGRRMGSLHMCQNWRVSAPLLRHLRAVSCAGGIQLGVPP